MSIKLESTPVNTVLVQVYMPTSDSTEEEVDKIYELIEDILDNSKNDNVIVMGDFNAVGKENKPNMLESMDLVYEITEEIVLTNLPQTTICSSATHGSHNLKDDDTHGKCQETVEDTNLITC